MQEITCKICGKAHTYEVNETCADCMPSTDKQSGVKIGLILLGGLGFTTGVFADNVLFDKTRIFNSKNEILASPNEIYTLYHGVAACIEKKSYSKLTYKSEYDSLIRECAQLLGKK